MTSKKGVICHIGAPIQVVRDVQPVKLVKIFNKELERNLC